MKFIGNVHIGRGSQQSLEEVFSLLEKAGEASRGSPDLMSRSYLNFGVEEARELRERAILRPLVAARRVFVVTASSLTTEAQNALLKLLEEPAADALFILLVPSPDSLLATLRSRAQSLRLMEGESISRLVDVRSFLETSGKRRLELLKPLLEKGDEDKRDIGAILGFLAGLEVELGKVRANSEKKVGLEAVYRARKYAADKGALLKPLLEQVALLVPSI
ncbi:MAG: hypothetical protein RIQ56_464 [Candidatus Parcubacteria bacterium]